MTGDQLNAITESGSSVSPPDELTKRALTRIATIYSLVGIVVFCVTFFVVFAFTYEKVGGKLHLPASRFLPWFCFLTFLCHLLLIRGMLGRAYNSIALYMEPLPSETPTHNAYWRAVFYLTLRLTLVLLAFTICTACLIFLLLALIAPIITPHITLLFGFIYLALCMVAATRMFWAGAIGLHYGRFRLMLDGDIDTIHAIATRSGKKWSWAIPLDLTARCIKLFATR